MSDYLIDSPFVPIHYCPGCEPRRDPVAEVLAVQYCAQHAPRTTGTEDERVYVTTVISNTEAGGEDNRAWCQFLHRGRR